MSTKQLQVLLLDVVSSLKADVATAVETLNSNFKAENVKLAADITSESDLTINVKIPGREPESSRAMDIEISGRNS